jgi:NAD(P)-dependent dehydrogenase (short-subunit alcohol dehydrogenase family)
MFELTDKVAVVTGAASGIGEAIAKTFAAAGAFVYIADRDVENGKRVAREIIETRRNALFLELDLANSQSCRSVADMFNEEWERIDIIVNNAGVGHVGTILDTTVGDLDRLYAINVRGAFELTKCFIPKMIERQHGVIVNTSSIGGVVAIKDRLAYCTTKFAMVGFTKCLALDHAKQGIRANAICPGRVETPFVKERISQYPDPQKAYEEMASTQALGRMATPDEIAACALYLASDEAAFVTGTALEIDGGFAVGK